jgi:hypothetical protein
MNVEDPLVVVRSEAFVRYVLVEVCGQQVSDRDVQRYARMTRRSRAGAEAFERGSEEMSRWVKAYDRARRVR